MKETLKSIGLIAAQSLVVLAVFGILYAILIYGYALGIPM